MPRRSDRWGQWQGAQEGGQAPPGEGTVGCHRYSVLKGEATLPASGKC
ncbi:hypothetical protein HMPREF9057_00406 [Actinomyces sp. oral taxon 171 str. F0337]|nr:hypothetical protein HMPREF9057_00406 [Actinomyces sp. oral taxon 171 str. F0337]